MSRSMMLKMFNEFALQGFKDDQEVDNYSFPVCGIADNPAVGIEDGCILLTTEDMNSIFAPTINQILSLTRDQIKAVEKEGLQISVNSTLIEEA